MRIAIHRALTLVAVTLLLIATAQADPQTPQRPAGKSSDAAVVAAIIAASIAAYRAGGKGPCACPDDVDRGGRRCGRRSAHSRGGGWTVLCSPADVTSDMVAAWRKQNPTR